MNSCQMSRRNILRNTLLATSGVALGSIVRAAGEPENQGGGLKGRIKQSASRWCYGKIPLDDLCIAGKAMGLKGLDLLGPDAFPTLKKHGMVCTMTSGFGNIIQPADHDKGVEKVINSIQANAEAGFPNVIVLAGYRKDIPDDDVGMTNAVTFLKRVAGVAEEKGICICMEYLNSKVDHKGYMFDNMAWGVEVLKRVGSPNVKILYDIYHAQIMEGDIIRTIQTHKDIIGHYHTGGNPGRNEIGETQEIFYPAIMRVIVETGYIGNRSYIFKLLPKTQKSTHCGTCLQLL